MNYKPIIIIALIVLVSLVALSNALHIYENGNITLEEHHDHGGETHEHNESDEHAHNESEEHAHNESDSHNESH